MTAGTLGEVRALPEGALSIVTSKAVWRARISEVLYRRDRADLFSLAVILVRAHRDNGSQFKRSRGP